VLNKDKNLIEFEKFLLIIFINSFKKKMNYRIFIKLLLVLLVDGIPKCILKSYIYNIKSLFNEASV